MSGTFFRLGIMGRGHLGSFLGMKDVQVIAVCDVVAERRDNALKMVRDRTGKDCKATGDFRHVLDNKDIEAVVIGTRSVNPVSVPRRKRTG